MPQFKLNPPSPILCVTYTDSDNKMVKINYDSKGQIGVIEEIQLPIEERSYISTIIEYTDGTIISTKISNDDGSTNIEINKPVIQNSNGEYEVVK